MTVAAVEKISGIRAERNSPNAPSDDRLPGDLPHELAASVPPRQFNQVLLEQSQHLQSTDKSTLLDDLEREFHCSKSSVHSQSSLSG
jgi:hypothetical protein